MTDVLRRFQAAVQAVTRRVDYLAPYAGKVVAQAAGGPVDVVLDDPRMPSLQGVPLRLGVPGVAATVPVGSRVLVQFENGDPGRPVATLWDATTAQLVINGGTANVARVGDTVDRSGAMATWMSAVSTATGVAVVPTTIGTVSSGTPNLKA